MLTLLNAIITLVPTLLGTFERFVSERDDARDESEGESLREARAMSAATKKQFADTLAKARAKLGATTKTAAKPLAVTDAPPLRAQVDQMIDLLTKVRDGLPPDA